MDKEPESEGMSDDPEIAALLEFAPVVQKMPRADGWTAERQRTFIAVLAETGNQEKAAHAVGMSARGAYSLRKYVDGAGFAAAWKDAIALHKKRLARKETAALAFGQAGLPAADAEAADGESGATEEVLAGILDRYRKKFQQERACRLEGRIVEADYYVRQLTFIELVLDLGGHAEELFKMFRSGEIDIYRTIGTPVSVWLDRVRRDHWREKGEPDRLPMPLLGEHDDKRAKGRRESEYYNVVRDGDYEAWLARKERMAALQAEAQRLWEEKARADAEAWADRVKRADEGPGAASAGDAGA